MQELVLQPPPLPPPPPPPPPPQEKKKKKNRKHSSRKICADTWKLQDSLKRTQMYKIWLFVLDNLLSTKF